MCTSGVTIGDNQERLRRKWLISPPFFDFRICTPCLVAPCCAGLPRPPQFSLLFVSNIDQIIHSLSLWALGLYLVRGKERANAQDPGCTGVLSHCVGGKGGCHSAMGAVHTPDPHKLLLCLLFDGFHGKHGFDSDLKPNQQTSTDSST